MTYILDMVVILNYIVVCRETYLTYKQDLLAIVNLNCVLPEDMCDLNTGHGSDR